MRDLKRVKLKMVKRRGGGGRKEAESSVEKAGINERGV
jgi:hypothetical protein